MRKDSTLNRQILEEASGWFVDFRVGDVDAGARERFDEWLRRSPEHIRAYWEIAKTYVELPALVPPDKLDVASLIAYSRSESNVVSLNSRAPSGEPTAMIGVSAESEIARRSAPSPQRRFFAAASIALVFTMAGAVLWQTKRYPSYSTDIGERRSITLIDGSTVDLNARSQLRIEFSKTERRVELLSGQALFQVTKDKQRPFIVRSGTATVRAVGTQFDVYRKDSGTTVTVLEGKVAVYSSAPGESSSDQSDTSLRQETRREPGTTSQHTPARASPGGTGVGSRSIPDSYRSNSGIADPSGAVPVLVSAGEQVTVTPDAIASPHQADAGAATAWLQRRLIFDGSKLSDVADEFNRYNRAQIMIDDVKLRDFEISGVYSSTDPSSLLRFLEDRGLQVTTDDREVHIRAH